MTLPDAAKFSLGETNRLPATGGVFWVASAGEILWARLAENVRRAAAEFVETKSEILSAFPAEKLEIFSHAPPDLLDFYAELLQKTRPRFEFVLIEEANLPFLILTTGERFPRVLATRRPENARAPGDSLYGPFVPRTGARFLLDFVRRFFKLHPCELDIKGDFDAPCPEYFLGHCLAPCVAEICRPQIYAETVEAAHLLLAGRGAELLERIDRKIEMLAEELEFEKAAEWRDRRATLAEILRSEKWKLNVAEMTDVLTIEEADETVSVYAATLRRGRRKAQNRFERRKSAGVFDKNAILPAFVAQYYRYFAPKRIFAPFDFPERKFLEKLLAEKFGRRIEISAEAANLPPTVETAQKHSAASFDHRPPAHIKSSNVGEELEISFGLSVAPRRIECFDVAHLAGEHIIAGRVVAEGGRLVSEEETVWEFKNLSEIDSLAAAVRERLRFALRPDDLPDLIVLDGARAHLAAVQRILKEFALASLPVVGVVKPAGEHSGVSHFLSNLASEKILFEPRSPAARFLQKMRDQAHELANRTHRQTRSLAGIFENRASGAPQIQYLRVPVRFAERFGAADDMIPLRSLSQTGKLLLKSKADKR